MRTASNVRDADGTLVLVRGRPRGGTALTCRIAAERDRPLLLVDLDDPPAPAVVRRWLADHAIVTLNVAGPRESTAPGIPAAAAAYLTAVLAGPRVRARLR